MYSSVSAWIGRHATTDRHTEADRQTERQTDRQRGRQTDREADRQTERQTDRQRGRQTDRQRGRQTDREADTRVGARVSSSLSKSCCFFSFEMGANAEGPRSALELPHSQVKLTNHTLPCECRARWQDKVTAGRTWHGFKRPEVLAARCVCHVRPRWHTSNPTKGP